MNKPLPTQARVIVIGGGAVGSSIAYHLIKAGETDVVLLEKSRLTEGATWHAAGLVGQFRALPNLTRIMADSVRLFETLGDETGQDIGWNQVGSLRVAASQDRWMELQRAATAGRSFGFEMELIGPEEAGELYPLLSTEGLVGAAFIAGDGHVDPVQPDTRIRQRSAGWRRSRFRGRPSRRIGQRGRPHHSGRH